jgi:predicted phage terminase large subunit-like protein
MSYDIDLQLKIARRLLALQEARGDLLTFMKLIRPDPEDIDDVALSRYQETPLARLLCQLVQKIFRREMKRVAVSVGPQMGKSDVLSRGAPAWMLGNDPHLNLILSSYNQPFANEFGDAVREIMYSPAFKQVFPNTALRKGATDLLITSKNGRAAFVGRGGSGTGKPADFFFVDDPLKDDIEAQSDTTRNEVWRWFNKVALTRCHENSAIIVVHTRWHQDDLIGRLCDPEHPERNKQYKGIADRWEYINLPAVVDDPKLAKALGLSLDPPTDPFTISMFGTKPMTSIWPGRKGLEFLAEAKQMDPAGFSALYMGAPSPEDGDYFKASWFVEYESHELPENLTKYGASDHAVGEKQRNDPSVLGCVGVDENDNIWVLPDLWWERLPTDQTIEAMLQLMKDHEPDYWWMEGDMISRSFGPFLEKRMQEDQVYCPIDSVIVSVDKVKRAQAIRGRMAHRKVRFPRFAPWWADARKELLNFPNGAHDDFVDFMAHVGLGLMKQHRAVIPPKQENNVVPFGSYKWMQKKLEKDAVERKRAAAEGGW